MKYNHMFLSSRKITSGSKLSLIKSSAMEEFVSTLLSDSNFTLEERMLFLTQVSGGLRISEALSIKKDNVIFEDDYIFIEVQVLKKRGAHVFRHIRIHPAGLELFKNFFNNRLSGKLFKMTVRTAQRKISKFNVANLTTHSFRHSAISYYLFEKELSIPATSKLVKVSSKIIDHYAHLDTREVLKKLY